MAFRGYFALNGVEIANSSRVVAHVGATVPTSDVGMLEAAEDCSLATIGPGRLLYTPPASSVPVAPGRLLSTPPDGSRLYGPGLAVVGDCWDTSNLCFGCRDVIGYDDSWDGLSLFLGDTIYRPELAPWYTTRVPESAEFGGIWVLSVKGLDLTPTQRDVIDTAGNGGAPGPHRTPVRKISFEAYLLACTNAGLSYGLQWLACQLHGTDDRSDSVLRYLAAHPGHSSAVPASLVREVHGVVLTQEPQIVDSINASRRPNQQATAYRVSWEMAVTRPHAYSPPIPVTVDWDVIDVEPIKWIHAADCAKPDTCDPMPVLFGEDCATERIEVVSTPPPTCGGCLPVCAVETRVFEVPVFDTPLRCHDTVVSITVRNTGERALTLQSYWRRCSSDVACEDNRWPTQISKLPPTAELVMDGISGRYWADYAGRRYMLRNIVSTPTGAPWQPPVIDRGQCWEFVVVSSGDDDFEVAMTLNDRES